MPARLYFDLQRQCEACGHGFHCRDHDRAGLADHLHGRFNEHRVMDRQQHADFIRQPVMQADQGQLEQVVPVP